MMEAPALGHIVKGQPPSGHGPREATDFTRWLSGGIDRSLATLWDWNSKRYLKKYLSEISHWIC